MSDSIWFSVFDRKYTERAEEYYHKHFDNVLDTTWHNNSTYNGDYT